MGASTPGASTPGASTPGASTPGAYTPGAYTPEELVGDDEISNTYAFEDKTPAEGENLYRLKMIDQDESFAYSKMNSVYFELEIVAYPNPVNDLLTLKWSALQTVQIFNSSGKMVYENSEKMSTIDISKLSAGVYIFKLIGNDGSCVLRKIVKK
ncbi:T9SS type A sorting domain-containing protein [Dyadobacter sp. CY326]|uniref:T9SS type A sorting domain-containing protein n=1 Tax=Dyadobacter sp. CY326 TaxID=2907300 RepID=UPI001F262CE5|nr:T9SS type A sorting domain-containing protein [Dyadobacter sp. CY326]MCE7068066.1 T9SS type A sorting domain-containing protein [Dyadobacter sp. CY326]